MLTFLKKAVFNYNQIRLVIINLGLGIDWDYIHYLNAKLKITPYDTP
jgi:hypothetical protein